MAGSDLRLAQGGHMVYPSLGLGYHMAPIRIMGQGVGHFIEAPGRRGRFQS
jgi:hypothetical protein